MPENFVVKLLRILVLNIILQKIQSVTKLQCIEEENTSQHHDTEIIAALLSREYIP